MTTLLKKLDGIILENFSDKTEVNEAALDSSPSSRSGDI